MIFLFYWQEMLLTLVGIVVIFVWFSDKFKIAPQEILKEKKQEIPHVLDETEEKASALLDAQDAITESPQPSPSIPSDEPLGMEEKEINAELSKKIRNFLLIYACIVTLVRMYGWNIAGVDENSLLGFIDGIAAKTKGVDTIFRLLYSSLPYVAFIWAYYSRLSHRCLTFLQGWAVVGGLDHILFAALLFPFHFITIFPRISYALQNILAFLLGLGMVMLFRWSKQLLSEKYEKASAISLQKGEMQKKDPDLDVVIAVVLLLIFFGAPFLRLQKGIDAREAAKKLAEVPQLEIVLSNDSEIRSIQGSPDGQLLAVGGVGGLYLWDLKTRTCIWSDPSISPDILRFSPNGKYLAAAKSDKTRDGIIIRAGAEGEGSLARLRSTQGLEKNLAIYEVATRKRLPIYLTPQKQRDPTMVLDIAFDARSENLHVASGWLYFDDNGGSSGFVHASQVRLHSGVHRDLYTIRGINHWYSWMSVTYAQDASRLFYLIGVDVKYQAKPLWRNLVVYDTQNWNPHVIALDEQYDIYVSEFAAYTGLWFESRYREGQLYFLAQKIDQLEMSDGKTLHRNAGDLFSAVDLKSGKTRVLFSHKWGRRGSRSSAVTRIALSPDGKKAALLGRSLSEEGEEWKHDVQIYIVRLSDGALLANIKRNFPTKEGMARKQRYPLFLTWVREDLLAVAQYRDGEIGLITLEKGLEQDGN